MTAVVEHNETTLIEVPVDQVYAHPDNPRRDAAPDEAMVASVRQVGVLEPLIVRLREDDQGWELLAGHRRLEAAKAAGLATVPCIGRTATDADAVEIMLVENLARRDLLPMEEAAGISRLADLGRSQRDIADLLGVSQSHVSKRLSLLKLPEAAQAAVDSGGITVEDALRIAKLDDKATGALFRNGIPDRYRIEDAVRRHEQAQARVATVNELRSAGVEILPDAPAWNADRAHPPVRIASLRHVDPIEHRAADCRAVFVDRYGYSTECCTDPANHPAPPPTDSDDDDMDDGVQGLERRAAQGRTDRERRHGWAQAHVARAPIPQRYTEVFALAAKILPTVADIDVAAPLELLDVELPDDYDAWRDGAALVQAWSDTAEHGPVRLVLAMCLAIGSDLVTHYDPDGENLTGAKAYLAYLRDHGHVLSEREEEILALRSAADETVEEADGPEPEEAAPAAATVSVVHKKKLWHWSCSACADAGRRCSTEEAARARAADHLWEAHGIR